VILSISGDNTNTVTTNVDILTYGSVYQGGYVFAVDDTTAVTTSIGGKVVSLVDQSAGIEWEPGCPSTACSTVAADSMVDGAANSTAIITALSSSFAANAYAAGLCTQTISGFSDWYLPAQCELSYGDNISSACGIVGSPTVQNIQSGLIDTSVLALSNSYWSSTQLTGGPPSDAALYTILGLSGFQAGDYKDSVFYVRCVRALTP
jgi:hypothetical protein